MAITSYDKTASLQLTLHISPLKIMNKKKVVMFAGRVHKVPDYFEKNYNSIKYILTKQ
jgi:hypothetical protein